MRDDPFPFILILVLVVSAVVILLWSLNLRFRRRELQHRERLAAFEKGVPLPATSERRPWSPRTYLLHGLIWLFSGATLAIFLFGVAEATRQPQSLESRLRNIKYLTDQGATQAQIDRYVAERRDDGMPPAFALIGLIPMGVGAAYLILYRAEMRWVTAQKPG